MKMVLLYAAYIKDGKQESRLFYSYESYHAETFNPETILQSLIDFSITGKSYAERKNCLIDKAVEFSTEHMPGLSYGELADISAWFIKQARRFGMLREFAENGII